MSLLLDHTKTNSISGEISISGSKSESNRLLILEQLFPNISIENLSNSDDTKYLQKALKNTSNTVNVGHAGTAMRFLTAFLAIQEGRIVTLTGSERMQERPIKILVEALRGLGADIKYLKNEGYPPILIKGKKLSKNKISIQGNISSQYISALLLIASSLQNGLEINLEGQVTSIPYIQMTLSLLNTIGVKTMFKDKTIIVFNHKNTKPKRISIEPDWSSASYFYGLTALQPNTSIELIRFKKESLQGDSILPEIYKQFGINTIFKSDRIIIKSPNLTSNFKPLALNLKNTPDLAQTIVVTCLGLGIDCNLTGLHTLKIKETDRLEALKNELEKLGASVIITSNSLQLKSPTKINKNVTIKTYLDHRMAMAFASLSVKVPLRIEEHEVVSKSYPNFWEDFEQLLS